MGLNEVRRRYLERAVWRLDHPSHRDGTWERIGGGRSGPALRWLRDKGLIRLEVHDATSAYRIVFEIEATDAGRAALASHQSGDAT